MNTKYYTTNLWPEMYADWLNNFLTPERFAEYYGITLEFAHNIIEMGRATDNFSKDWPTSDGFISIT